MKTTVKAHMRKGIKVKQHKRIVKKGKIEKDKLHRGFIKEPSTMDLMNDSNMSIQDSRKERWKGGAMDIDLSEFVSEDMLESNNKSQKWKEQKKVIKEERPERSIGKIESPRLDNVNWLQENIDKIDHKMVDLELKKEESKREEERNNIDFKLEELTDKKKDYSDRLLPKLEKQWKQEDEDKKFKRNLKGENNGDV